MFLSTALYTVETEEEVAQFLGMAEGMRAGYAQQPGFRRLVVGRDVIDPMTIVTMSWWDSAEDAAAWTKSTDYRQTKSDAGGGGLKAKMEFGRWESAS